MDAAFVFFFSYAHARVWVAMVEEGSAAITFNFKSGGGIDLARQLGEQSKPKNDGLHPAASQAEFQYISSTHRNVIEIHQSRQSTKAVTADGGLCEICPQGKYKKKRYCPVHDREHRCVRLWLKTGCLCGRIGSSRNSPAGCPQACM